MAWITGSDLATFLKEDPAAVGAAAATSDYTRRANAACDMIERYCDCHIQAATYHQWLDGTGTSYLPLPELPILNVYMVSHDYKDAISIGNTSAGATDFFVSVENGQMTLTIYGGVNAGNDVITLSAHASMAALRVAILALAKSWTATVWRESDPLTLRPLAITTSANEVAYCYAADPDLWVPVRIMRDEGMLYSDTGFAEGIRNMFVHWQAGYATVPDDLTETALHVAGDIWEASDRGRFLQAEKSGDYSSSLRYAAGRSDASILGAYERELAPYRNFTV